MMRRSALRSRLYRPYYNLASKSASGRLMTGHMTAYRHWMWKQNELWRNVHEAQFEHLRRTYRRQWFESFRVNADEYIHKYNITKAAQYAQWEHEMQQQENKRVQNQQLAQGRQQLKAKHLDLLREYHERHFFYWYERASERLQYMTQIKYVSQDQLSDHIEAELNKYVAGRKDPYPLNFAGQMPMIEDFDGNIVQVPESLLTNHFSERPSSNAAVFEAAGAAGDEQLKTAISAAEEELQLEDASAIRQAVDDISREEEAQSEDAKIAITMEESDDDRAINRIKYIQRGQTGSKGVYRRPKTTSEGGAPAPAAETGGSVSSSSSSTGKKKKKKLDAQKRASAQQDAILQQSQGRYVKPLEGAPTKAGEVLQRPGRLRDRLVLPSVEEVLSYPELKAGSEAGAKIKTKARFDEVYDRKKKPRGGSDSEL